MNENSATWTVNDLARLAAAALAAGSPTQPNGRIREVPDVRTIRWYTSIGLLDRPAAMRGRTALYGRSHLAQLVAIKRLQAGGLTVASVQERLLGADASAIEEIAGLPADLAELDHLPDLDHFADLADQNSQETATGSGHPPAGPASRSRFWASPVAPRTADEESAARSGQPSRSAPPSAKRSTPRSVQPSAQPSAQPSVPPTAPTAPSAPIADVGTVVHGIRLAVDVTLLLPPGRLPDAADRAAIAEAARPLLDLLDRLGLSEA